MSGGGDSSLNAPLKGDGEGTSEWQDWLADDDADQAAAYAESQELDMRRELLLEAMETLNEREQHILTERRLKEDPVTLEDLSKVYDVSRERIRQIEVRGFEKLQKRMRELAAGKNMIPAVEA
jgi:RNA polymerase sigma-32 factor